MIVPAKVSAVNTPKGVGGRHFVAMGAKTSLLLSARFPQFKVLKNSPRLAVDLNNGTGSRSLNADLNALLRLHFERGANSTCSGLKYASCIGRARNFCASSSLSMKAR